MKNPSRKWKLFHLSSREAGRAVVLLFVLLLFTITGCDNGGDDTPFPPVADTTLHTPGDLAAFKQVLTNIPDDNITGISSDGGLALFKLNWQLTDANWKGILAALRENGRYVSLDLSACTKSADTTGTGLRSDGKLCLNTDSTAGKGQENIVEIILPAQATSMENGGYNSPTSTSPDNKHAFYGFTALRSIRGAEITNIGINAFRSLPLETIDLPKVREIGIRALYGCSSLVTASFPALIEVKKLGFYGCSSLENLTMPAATTIGDGAFYECSKLARLDLPEVTKILYEDNDPNISNYGAFQNCTSLTELDIPKISEIGDMAFQGCSNSASLVITMGPAAPKVGINSFRSITAPRTVTVKKPAKDTGYDANWQNGFKGLGWDGTAAGVPITSGGASAALINPELNTAITLTVTNL
ncbi:MAG: leucine-rich repeat domain-containing protein [Treponema sp.]|jgi:hypothetical protein|nr:leucine-rich repeat domain-containing protein [Treponema sp.]